MAMKLNLASLQIKDILYGSFQPSIQGHYRY